MNYIKHLVCCLALGLATPLAAQSAALPSASASGGTSLKALTVDNLAAWQRITARSISDNGQWTACRMAPLTGDGSVRIYNDRGEETARYTPGEQFLFSASSNYLLVVQPPTKALTDSLKLRKTKADKMPMNRLIIRHLSGEEETIDSLRTYRLAKEADWLAYQRGRKDSTLYVCSLDGSHTFRFPSVSDFGFAAKSEGLFYVSRGDSTGSSAGLFTLLPGKGAPVLVKEGKGVFKQTAWDEQGRTLAFLYCADKDSTHKALGLWLSEQQAPAREIVARGNPALPTGWVISEHGALQFSENATRLFFGSSPEPRQKDTTLLAEQRPDVQVWSWDEPVQYTVQNYNKEKDLKKSYRAVYNLPARTVVQLATEEIPDIQLGDRGNADLALLSTSIPYSLPSMWEGRTRQDYYTVSLITGERQPIVRADYTRYRLSPKGTYAYGYAETDSSWYTLSLADRKTYRLTTPQTFAAWDEQNDVPDYPEAYGAAGWTSDDRHLLLYDRYDIWQFDPQGASAPVNLTVNGRRDRLSYRLLTLDPEARFVDPSASQLLLAFNEKTKGSGFYAAHLSKAAAPRCLLAGDFMLKTPLKARKADAVVYTSETYQQYPDLLLSNLSFKKSIRLTDGWKQQQDFLWGSAELVSWTSLDGTPLEGVVYKPANFDPTRKYPLLVNFYERNSETLYNYHMPEPHRSTIDYHFYNSHEYIIFNPDVRYVDGYPGESCYNCVMPGITSLLSEGYIDEKAIGAQGHSWGGYQVAYLATRTTLFAAIESGAPVVNMFSAYGGIRWGSGLNRSFQYEHQQSRLGATPWSSPLRYFENSPLFNMDKVETPILIMHNDADGHVPWYQGIEYFVALKRLQKPCWMLNYTGEPHWPMRLANRMDFQKRMFQFFDHYLKGRPMPQWMAEGVRATEQPFLLGY